MSKPSLLNDRFHVCALAAVPWGARGFLLIVLAASACAALAADPALPRLRVSDNGRFLVTADGAPFFWLGDTAWHMFGKSVRDDSTNQPSARLYFSNRAAKGFTVIQSVIVRSPEGGSMATQGEGHDWVLALNDASLKFQLPSLAAAEGAARGPLRVHPKNPRYFTDGSGKAIYLTGSHTWNNFQHNGAYPAVNYDDYLAFLRRHNHNFIRLWVWEQGGWDPWDRAQVVSR